MREKILLFLLCGYLGLSNGYLTVFRDGTPPQVLPYRAALYSQADQAAFRAGIPFQSELELTELLEAYLS